MERNAILKLAESYDSFYLYEEAVILRNINRLSTPRNAIPIPRCWSVCWRKASALTRPVRRNV